LKNLADKIREAGVIGAGGAGFPTHIKLSAKPEWYLANGAECEPLLHKDKELMTHFPAEIIEGLILVGQAAGASKLAIGIKAKNKTAISAIQGSIQDSRVQIVEFGDFYPSGDEYEVVHTITGRLIPPGGIPLDVGCVVNNVETLFQVTQAARGIPVTETLLTISGEVADPITCWVPIGTPIREVLELAGGSKISKFAIMKSGLMMGELLHDIGEPVTKTTAGWSILPADHELIRRYATPPEAMARIGKSACDQCSYCTELCPRYLLGYDIQPHAVMRSLGFSATGSELWNQYALLCCGCGICTLYACPEALYPREACLEGIRDLKNSGKARVAKERQVKVHPMKEFRRIPMNLLMKRLGVSNLDSKVPFSDITTRPEKVKIPLKQHMGVPAEAVVAEGDMVVKGQLIGEIPESQLGARVHSSISGQVKSVGKFIEIERIEG